MIEEPFRKELRLDIVTRTIYVDVQETCYMHGVQWGHMTTAAAASPKKIPSTSTSSSHGGGGGGGVVSTASPVTTKDSIKTETGVSVSGSEFNSTDEPLPWLFMGTWPWQQTPPWAIED
jgi:hypothetical protein